MTVGDLEIGSGNAFKISVYCMEDCWAERALDDWFGVSLCLVEMTERHLRIREGMNTKAFCIVDHLYMSSCAI